MKAWSELDQRMPRGRSPASLHVARVQAYSVACLKRRVDEIGASSSTSDSTVSAASRMEALTWRVGERIGSHG